MSTLLFDIGGTTTRMAVGDDTVSRIQKVPTPLNPEDVVALLASYVNEQALEIQSAEGGIAGVIEEGVIRTSPHLSSWNGFPFAERLSATLGIPVRIRNDAEMAALGEAVHGAGKGYGIVAYLGIGTGIGGALVVNGEVAPHASGFEPGHQVLDIDTGDTFEGLVSGHALENKHGSQAKELSREIYGELTPTLAAGIYNVLLAWAPDVLVLGGSLMNEENGYRVTEVEDALARMPSALPSMPLILRASLGDECGLYGALSAASS